MNEPSGLTSLRGKVLCFIWGVDYVQNDWLHRVAVSVWIGWGNGGLIVSCGADGESIAVEPSLPKPCDMGNDGALVVVDRRNDTVWRELVGARVVTIFAHLDKISRKVVGARIVTETGASVHLLNIGDEIVWSVQLSSELSSSLDTEELQ